MSDTWLLICIDQFSEKQHLRLLYYSYFEKNTQMQHAQVSIETSVTYLKDQIICLNDHNKIL